MFVSLNEAAIMRPIICAVRLGDVAGFVRAAYRPRFDDLRADLDGVPGFVDATD